MSIISFLVSLVIFIAFETINWQPGWLYWIAPVLFTVIFSTFFYLINFRKINHKETKGLDKEEKSRPEWQFLIILFCFVLSGLLFFIFIQNLFLRHLFTLLISSFSFVALRNIFSSDKPSMEINNSTNKDGSVGSVNRQEKEYSASEEFKNIFHYLNLLAVFFFFSSFGGLKLFLDMPDWLLTVMVFLLGLGLGCQMMWIYKVLNKKGFLYILIVSLVLAELFLIIAFLPNSFYVKGLILTLAYYSMAGIACCYLTADSDCKKVFKYYLMVGGATLGAALLTTRWY